jgi:diguanylate cyclase
VALPSREVTGVEALVRWEHPRHGLLAPEQFVPLAERAEVIEELGRWVLEQACAQAKVCTWTPSPRASRTRGRRAS